MTPSEPQNKLVKRQNSSDYMNNSGLSDKPESPHPFEGWHSTLCLWHDGIYRIHCMTLTVTWVSAEGDGRSQYTYGRFSIMFQDGKLGEYGDENKKKGIKFKPRPFISLHHEVPAPTKEHMTWPAWHWLVNWKCSVALSTKMFCSLLSSSYWHRRSVDNFPHRATLWKQKKH